MDYTKYVLVAISTLLLSVLIWREYTHYNSSNLDKTIVLSKEKESIAIHNDKSFSDLKKEDRSLYDSIQKYGKTVETVYKLKYVYKHTTDTIYIDTVKVKPSLDSIYTIKQETDTVTTNLTIKASDLKWVKVDTEFNDSITIINMRDKTNNRTLFTSSNNSLLTPETVFRKKRNNENRIVIGPSVGIGYGINSKKTDLFVGVSVTLRLF